VAAPFFAKEGSKSTFTDQACRHTSATQQGRWRLAPKYRSVSPRQGRWRPTPRFCAAGAGGVTTLQGCFGGGAQAAKLSARDSNSPKVQHHEKKIVEVINVDVSNSFN
jgi:hypothetical protein